jgi:UDP-N-acetylmuramoyl-L-alanyl-D-glutamate--2,6-diaminopimelate ligase
MSIRPNFAVSKSLSDFDPIIFDQDCLVSGVCINAQQVKKGDLFIALEGAKTHGAKFIEQAVKNGAVAVLSDKKLDAQIPSFITPDPRKLIGQITAWLYSHPFEQLVAAGVTGTNGKTTTANLVKQIWQLSGVQSALIGTLGVQIGGENLPTARTTPEADELQALAAIALEKGCTNLVMEVSSHAIDQSRVKGCKYKIVAFTNLTQDHLDYHKTMDSYFAAKANLFTAEYASAVVINIDDPYGAKLASESDIAVTTVSRRDSKADYYLKRSEVSKKGYFVEIVSKKGEVITGDFGLLGDFNLENLLLAVAIAHLTGVSTSQITSVLSKLNSVPGRLEKIDAGQSFTALVDYAHSPDAVERVLKTARSFTGGKIIGVLGCGGDRDSSKRALMGKALFNGCDQAIFTSDNPRSESADQILSQMIDGLVLGSKGFVFPDRKQAIDQAVKLAKDGDTVLVLGKGHESGQDFKGLVTPFDDRIELTESIKRGMKS